MSPSDPGSLVGQRIAHYEILQKLGAGGMGEVYLAHDEQLHRNVAIKVLPGLTTDDPTARARLVREARAAAALNHPHICTVHEVGEADRRAYIAMELVEGQTLADRLTAGPLPVELAVRYAAQLADALAHAHDRGVVHRDFKSANVILTPDGRVKVLDFGLAKRLTASDVAATVTRAEATFSEPGTIAGTLAYMAPEQLRGQIAQAPSDVWAFGVVLFEMATGARPYEGRTSFELSSAILNEPPPPLSAAVPAGLQAVIARCLEKEPSQRYKAGGEVRAALDVIQTATDVPRVTSGSVPVVPSITIPLLSRRQVLWLGAAAAVVIASGYGAWRVWHPAVPQRLMAVLPLANLTKDEDLDYLCEGVADSLITQISKLRSFRVSPLTAALNFKGQTVDPATAGRQLGVETILTGSLDVKGDRLLITARLVDVPSGSPLWTKSYDREALKLLDVQNEIAGAIMDDGLRLRLNTEERRALVRRPTNNGEAYDLYLQARHVQRRASEDTYLQSRELLKKAVILDERFAQAFGALSGNYAMAVTDGLERPTVAWPEVNRYMRQAIQLDPDLPEIHAYRHALAFLFDWDWEGAKREREALLAGVIGDLDPHSLRALAAERWALGHPDEALQYARRTRELDPLSVYLAILEADYLLRTGQFDAAAALYELSIKRDSENPNAYFGLAEVRQRQRRFDEAIAVRRQAHALLGDDGLKDVLSTARGEQGYRQIEQAWLRVQLEALKAREPANYVSPLDFARVYAQLGERELAFTYLDKAYDDHSPGLVFLKVDPAWDRVRDDPRLAEMIKRVGLP